MEPGLVDVPLLSDAFGSIGVVEGSVLLPFEVKRFYFIHRVPEGAERGSHAHRNLEQLILAVTGSVVVELDDGSTTVKFVLDSPGAGLHIPPGYWRTLTGFSEGTVVAVLASHEYDESDYIRDYDEFLTWSRRA